MSQFSKVDAIRPRRSVFNLSNVRKMTCDMGKLYPFFFRELIPGDKFTLKNRVVVRANPLVAPVYSSITARTEYFFVPTRLLWEDWETFFTKGVTGDETLLPPRWIPCYTDASDSIKANTIGEGSLWDYFGLPTMHVGMDTAATGYTQWQGWDSTNKFNSQHVHAPGLPLDFPRRAYFKVWADYYGDETLDSDYIESIGDYGIGTIGADGCPDSNLGFQSVLHRSWKKDRFTSALPWQQRGTPAAIPISGILPVIFDSTPGVTKPYQLSGFAGTSSIFPSYNGQDTSVSGDSDIHLARTTAQSNRLGANVKLDEALTFTPSDLRLAFQIQLWQEQNARGGIRYTEFLRSHWSVSPRDDRLQRPEFIGSTRQPVVISEVLQTSSSDGTSPQGNLAGHGISAEAGFVGNYYAQEPGYIIGLFSLTTPADYQQGVSRELLRETPFDYAFPEFVHLSEQEVFQSELYMSGNATENAKIFGFQGRLDEYRTALNEVCGEFRTSLSYWHLGRQFDSAPGLNNDFIRQIPSKRIFAVPSEPGFLVQIANDIRAVRPLPYSSLPGLIDHRS